MNDKNIFVNFGAGNPVAGWQNLDSSPFFMLHPIFHKVLYGLKIFQRSKKYLTGNYQYYKFSSTKELPYEDNSVSAVYASHVLEHLSLEEINHFFAECHRILKKNGTVRVLVPDLESKILLSKHVFSLEYDLLTLPKELKSNKLRAVLEAFHGFPSFHKTLFVRKNIREHFKKDWKVNLKKGYLDSSIPKGVLVKVEQESRTKHAVIFELTKK